MSLDRELYYHGEDLPIHVSINNNSKKSVKTIRVRIKTTNMDILAIIIRHTGRRSTHCKKEICGGGC